MSSSAPGTRTRTRARRCARRSWASSYKIVLFVDGPSIFLADADIDAAKHRLTRVLLYRDHLVAAAEEAGTSSPYKVTNRQKRLVAHYKVFKYIYIKYRYRVVRGGPVMRTTK